MRVAAILALCLSVAGLSAQSTGGFVELATAGTLRPPLTQAQIAAFVGARGRFTFPAPYGTTGYRLTVPADCPGQTDCVQSSGYAYWRRISNVPASPVLKVFLTFAASKGGVGPAYVMVDKVSGVVSAPVPLFAATDARRQNSGETWYFSATAPNTLYFKDDTTSPALKRIDVVTKAESTVFSLAILTGVFGTSRYPGQIHSSFDDRVHSFTVSDGATYRALGCGTYSETTKSARWFPILGTDFDECQIDRSGRWLIIKENVDSRYGYDNRLIDLSTGTETLLLDEQGAGGHSDNGFGVVVAEDNWFPASPAWRTWTFGLTPSGPGTLVHRLPNWSSGAPTHVSFLNATTAPLASQYACGSAAEREARPGYGNEIVCFMLDGSLRTLVVAPTMTNLDAAGGGDDYNKAPKGNIDVTGEYFMWTTNFGGPRLNAVLVKITRDTFGVLPVPTPTPVPSPVGQFQIDGVTYEIYRKN